MNERVITTWYLRVFDMFSARGTVFHRCKTE